MTKWKVAVAILGILIVAGYLGIQWMFFGQYRLVSFSTRNPDITIELLADNFYDNGRGLYYQVLHSGRVIVPLTFVSGVGEYPDASMYSVASADSSSLHAVLEANRIIVLHDIQSNQSWPNGMNSEGWRSIQELGESLAVRFRLENPTLKLAE